MDFLEFVRLILFFLLIIYDIFSLKRLKSEEFSFFREGLVTETPISPPSFFPGAAPGCNIRAGQGREGKSSWKAGKKAKTSQ